MLFKLVAAFGSFAIVLVVHFLSINSYAQYEELGTKLEPQQISKIKWAEKKLKKPISFEFSNTLEKFSTERYARGFAPHKRFKIGDFEGHGLVSVSHSNRKTAAVKIDQSLKGDEKRIRAVIDHSFLHFNLSLRPFPFFYVVESHGCSSTKQTPNRIVVRHLQDLVHHRMFKTEFDKSGYYDLFDFEKRVVRNTKEHLNAFDFYVSAVNYARAHLEFRNKKDLDKIRQIYLEGGGQKALAKGEEIAKIIRQATLSSPRQLDRLFRSVLNTLYSPKKPFRFSRDKYAKRIPSRRNMFEIQTVCSFTETK